MLLNQKNKAMFNKQYELYCDDLWPTIKTKSSLTRGRKGAEIRRILYIFFFA